VRVLPPPLLYAYLLLPPPAAALTRTATCGAPRALCAINDGSEDLRKHLLPRIAAAACLRCATLSFRIFIGDLLRHHHLPRSWPACHRSACWHFAARSALTIVRWRGYEFFAGIALPHMAQ
jgi:hypothetical protein